MTVMFSKYKVKVGCYFSFNFLKANWNQDYLKLKANCFKNYNKRWLFMK